MLHVFNQRTSRLRAVDLLRGFGSRPTHLPLRADARKLHRAEGWLFEAAADFEALALGPVGPLGAARVLGGIHQNNVLSALRGHEVQGDPSLWLALEASRRRRHSPDPVDLCASQRVLRMQPLPDPALRPHFQLFACLTASRGPGVARALRRHLRVYLRVLSGRYERVVVELSDTARVRRELARHGIEVSGQFKAHDLEGSRRYLAERGLALPRGRGLDPWLERELLEPLSAEFPGVEMVVDLGRTEGLSYYSGPVLRILAARAGGPLVHLVDGGRLDWTARLLCDRAEWTVTSGIGVDRLAESA